MIAALDAELWAAACRRVTCVVVVLRRRDKGFSAGHD